MHRLNIFTQPETTNFYQQLKEPEAHLGKKNHHIFIRFLEAGPLKIVQL